MQKDVIARARRAGKLVITATQMLESMIAAPEPTRAEVTDVANAVIDGTSAVMLSAESSVGQHPVEAVRAMATIAAAAEESPDLRRRGLQIHTPAEAIMHAAVQLADDVEAAAIIVATATGASARACCQHRPRQPVVALAHDPRVAEQLTLEWGVYPVLTDVSDSLDDIVAAALRVGRDVAGLRSGDRIVVTYGQQPGTPGATDATIVRTLP
jgi:pyruvate kinase